MKNLIMAVIASAIPLLSFANEEISVAEKFTGKLIAACNNKLYVADSIVTKNGKTTFYAFNKSTHMYTIIASSKAQCTIEAERGDVKAN